MKKKDKTRNRHRAHILCLLLTLMICLSGTPIKGYCETEIVSVNTSGNLNRKLSVDPIANREGFSAVLYNNRNGMPTSEANAIAQTGEGFLWIGSYAGLIRYDGNTFERIDSAGGIANVRCLYQDSRDRLWIGTNDAGVFLMEKGQFQKWGKEDGLESVSIRAIAEDEDENIYISGAAAGISVIDPEGGLVTLEDARVQGQDISNLRRGADGMVYGFTRDGDLFTLKNGGLTGFWESGKVQVKGMHSILPDPEHPGFIYIGTDNSEVYYGELAESFTPLDKKDVAPLSIVNSMEYIDGQIWLCAGNGTGRLDSEGFSALDNVPMYNAVERVLTDHEGNLWFVSSHQGVMKIVRNQFSDLFERYDLPKNVVNSTCIYDRKLFIGTDSGLIVMDGPKRMDSVPLTKAVTASGKELEVSDLLQYLQGIRIRSITQDSKGRLWIPTWRKHGLLCYEHGELTVYTKEDGLFSDTARVICELEDGSIAAANTGGVSIIEDNRVTGGYGEKDGIVNNSILTLTEGFNHELILGSDGGGIYIITPEGVKHIGTEEGLNSEVILRIKRSINQNLYWIVTGNSLAYMTPDYQVTTIRGFPYPNNYDLYENSKGDVWVLSSAGVYVASMQELMSGQPFDPVFFGIKSGLPYVATANSSSELTPGGDLYMAGSEGVVKVNIEKPFENLGNLKTALPYIDADGERYYPNREGKFSIPGNTQKLTLYPYVFNYSLIDPQVIYRLDGFDTMNTTVTRSKLMPVDYTNLKTGSYKFVMTVTDSVGRTAKTVSFSITKGREVPVGTVGSIIMNAAAILLMIGILIYTSLYRKRGRLQDKIFFWLILSNMALAVGEWMSGILEFTAIPLTRPLMIACGTVSHIMFVFFSYLLYVYLDYATDPDLKRVRKTKILAGIPCILFAALMILNLKTGWIFSIGEENVYHSGSHSGLVYLPAVLVLIFYLLSLVKVYRTDKRMAALGAALLVIRCIWEFWYRDISSTSFIYTLILESMHLYVMNRPLYEEVS